MTLKTMKRDQLNAEAERLGIEGVQEMETREDVIAAIESTDAFKAEEDTKATVTYLVGDVEVDPNGQPVKGA